jgi:hypothetical protein
MKVVVSPSIQYDTEKCFFCGGEPKTTTITQFLDMKGNEVDQEVPYCGECLKD